MFVCGICKGSIGPRINPIKLVTATRRREYPSGGVGWEIVREANSCQPCAVRHLEKKNTGHQ